MSETSLHKAPPEGATKQVSILIVGAGIAGLATAVALAQKGQHVTVLERSALLGEVGAGIQLAPNATCSLDRLGVLEEVLQNAVIPHQKKYMDALSGETVVSIDLGQRLLDRFGYPYIVTHRNDLHKALQNRCRALPGIQVLTSKEVMSVADEEDSVVVRCQGGATFRAEMLIGADGLRSVVRKVLVDDNLVPSRYVALRGTIAIDAMNQSRGEPVVMSWMGPKLHMVQYPLRGGKLYNQVAVFQAVGDSDSAEWDIAAQLGERFKECCPPILSAIQRVSTDKTWSMFDRDPIKTWVQNRIVVLGDAAHPMLQYIGQGGCSALDDAVAFGELFPGIGSPNLTTALLRFQEERGLHTRHLQGIARMVGDGLHLEDGFSRKVRNAFFRGGPGEDYDALDWIWRPRMGGLGVEKTRNYPVNII